MSKNFYIGLFFTVSVALYGIYSYKKLGKEFDDEGGYSKSVILRGVLGGFVLTFVGLYLVFG